MTLLSPFSHLPFITWLNCSTVIALTVLVCQYVTNANGLLGIWRWDGEVGILCLAELYIHINDYDIERDAQVTMSYLFYSFALAHTFLCYFRQTSQFSHLQSSSHWKFVGSYDKKLLFIVSWWYKELIIVKIHEILKKWNVLVIIL